MRNKLVHCGFLSARFPGEHLWGAIQIQPGFIGDGSLLAARSGGIFGEQAVDNNSL
jgi:hypothetical protein